ncbi:hypothetical protein ACRWQN_00455 [Shewanella sp. HL-SH8]|uniref:hypothetical protein n=1 Tax=Shewanella sp. HL-SH8 TaxID=3436242 RepID=UPI003EB72172
MEALDLCSPAKGDFRLSNTSYDEVALRPHIRQWNVKMTDKIDDQPPESVDKTKDKSPDSADKIEENLAIFDFDSLPKNAEWFDKNPHMRPFTAGVLSYLCSVYNLKRGFCRPHDHSKGPRFLFNEKKDGSILRVHLAQRHLTVYISGPKSWVKAHGATQYQGHRGGNSSGEVSKTYRMKFKIEEPVHLEHVERFLLKVNIYNFNQAKLGFWKTAPTNWVDFNDQLQVSSFAMQATQRLIQWHEELLGRKFERWLKNGHLAVSEVGGENKIETSSRERADFTFRLKGKPVLAELKSVCNYKYSVKSCIRKATGQLLEYGFYNYNKDFSELWIVVDGTPEQADIEYIERLQTKFNIQYRLYYLEGDEFTLAC